MKPISTTGVEEGETKITQKQLLESKLYVTDRNKFCCESSTEYIYILLEEKQLLVKEKRV
jgi:hypothetical protein